MAINQIPVVNTHNEWDPLEEVIVGIVDGARVPPWDIMTPATVHHKELLDFPTLNLRGEAFLTYLLSHSSISQSICITDSLAR